MKRMRVVTRALLIASTVSGRDWADVERLIAGARIVVEIAAPSILTIRLKELCRAAGREDTACGAPTGETACAARRLYCGRNPNIKRPPRMAIGVAGGRGRSRREFRRASLLARRASDGVL